MPITAIAASILALIYTTLSFRVARARQKHKIGVGDGGEKTLTKAIRVHANFIEYVPLALILLMAYEINGGTAWVSMTVSAALIFARLLHILGLSQTLGVSRGRLWGSLLTWLIIAGLACLNLLVGFGY